MLFLFTAYLFIYLLFIYYYLLFILMFFIVFIYIYCYLYLFILVVPDWIIAINDSLVKLFGVTSWRAVIAGNQAQFPVKFPC